MGSGREKGDHTFRPLAFSIVLTDREPGTGLKKEQNRKDNKLQG